MSISFEAKAFLEQNGMRPKYINKNGFKCLSIMCTDNPLVTSQRILNDLTMVEGVSLDLFRAFLYFKYEGFGLDSTIYWPKIPFEG